MEEQRRNPVYPLDPAGPDAGRRPGAGAAARRGDGPLLDDVAEGIAQQYDRFQASLGTLERQRQYLNYGYTTRRDQSYEDRQEALCLQVLEAADVGPHHRLVDVGFGSGEQDLLWASRADFESLVGFNISSAQVEQARRRARERGLEGRLTFVHGAAEEMPGLAPGSVHRVLAVECAFYFRRADFYRRAAEVLAPGGRLVAADIAFSGAAAPATRLREDLARVGTLSRNRALWERHFRTLEVRPIHRFVRPGVQLTVRRILETIPRSRLPASEKREWLSMAFWSQLVALGLATRLLRYDLVILERRREPAD